VTEIPIPTKNIKKLAQKMRTIIGVVNVFFKLRQLRFPKVAIFDVAKHDWLKKKETSVKSKLLQNRSFCRPFLYRSCDFEITEVSILQKFPFFQANRFSHVDFPPTSLQHLVAVFYISICILHLSTRRMDMILSTT
jgi:hypothetical protein